MSTQVEDLRSRYEREERADRDARNERYERYERENHIELDDRYASELRRYQSEDRNARNERLEIEDRNERYDRYERYEREEQTELNERYERESREAFNEREERYIRFEHERYGEELEERFQRETLEARNERDERYAREAIMVSNACNQRYNYEEVEVREARVRRDANFRGQKHLDENLQIVKDVITLTEVELKILCEDCPICMNKPTKLNSVTTECGHEFCKDCYNEYLAADNNKSCPMCRNPNPKITFYLKLDIP